MRRIDARQPGAADDLAAVVVAHSHVPLYASVGENDEASRELYGAAGFVAERRESVYLVPTDPAVTQLPGLEPGSGIALRSAARVDVDRLRLLDDELRQDVPGSDGWRWTDNGFREETFSSEFDPETYLVAVVTATDEYVGITRIWIGSDRPRLGFVGVRPAFRRRGIAKGLLAQAFSALHERRVPVVSTEIDDTNVASRSLIEPLGARRVGGVLELVRRPA